MAKVHAPLIRALAHTGLHRWAYDGFDHLTELGIDAYIAERRDAGDGSRHIRSRFVDRGRDIVERHAAAFAVVNGVSRGPDADALCRLLLDCDDTTLAWWCEHRFGPALDALDIRVAP